MLQKLKVVIRTKERRVQSKRRNNKFYG
jgi:hypothetical protein